jgi:hypothetical protein
VAGQLNDEVCGPEPGGSAGSVARVGSVVGASALAAHPGDVGQPSPRPHLGVADEPVTYRVLLAGGSVA